MLVIFISMYSELIEVLSGPSEMTVAMTANTIQPRAMVSGVSSDITIMSTGGGQLISNVPVIDVPVLTETMCTQPSTFDEGKEGYSIHDRYCLSLVLEEYC